MEEVKTISKPPDIYYKSPSKNGEKNHHTGTKFRYIIHGIPKNKKYTIEEARWCDHQNHFSVEYIHTISSSTLKLWAGYIPASIGDIKITMWIYLPHTIYNPKEDKSPLKMWESNPDVFIPYSFEKLRYFPNGTCHEQARAIPFYH